MNNRTNKIALLLLIAIVLAGIAFWPSEEGRLRIATTTSLYDTKLLDLIESNFEDMYDVTVDTVSGGTGIAIQYGERGDVDLLLVHDKVRELQFIEDGHGLERRCFAFNYFYVVGPADDPAGIRGMDATSALKRIKEKGMEIPDKVKFISRGDNSGTHAREKLLWEGGGYKYTQINTSGPWYLEAGQGMGATLMMANEKRAYTLCDMSTFMAFKGNLTLDVLIEGGGELLNVYTAMAIDPKTHPGVNCELANKFINYLVSDEGQKIIATYGEDVYGQPLFFKAAGNCELIGCSPEECAVPTCAPCAAA